MAYIRQAGQWVVQAYFGASLGWQQIDDEIFEEWADSVERMKEIAPEGCVAEYRVYRTDDIPQEVV